MGNAQSRDRLFPECPPPGNPEETWHGTGVVAPTQASGLFVLDGEQRIVQWSSAAASLLSVPAACAVGRHCYEVVQGVDGGGRRVCRPGCRAFRLVRDGGREVANATLRPAGWEDSRRLRCQLCPVPEPGEGALAIVSEVTGEADRPSGPERPSGSDTVLDLAAVLRLLATIWEDGSRFSARSTLSLLREATAAEFAELFLWDEMSGEMLLTGYEGPFRTAFWQQLRFRAGEGFPGLVCAQRGPVISDHLVFDSRYLRTRVKALGFTSYCCVPLVAAGQLVGAICVGSRDQDFDLEAAVRLITWASAPVAAAIQADMLRARGALEDKAWDSTVEPAEPSDALAPLLRSVCDLLKADGGRLIPLADGRPVGIPVSVGISSDAGCWPAGDVLACPALAESRSVDLSGSRRSWHPACQRIQQATPVVLCTPVRTGKEPVALLQMFYTQPESTPPTTHLPLLQSAASAIAPRVRWIRDRELYRVGADVGLWRQRRAISPGGPAGEPEPYLRIRCFGTFELYRDGVYVAPRQWKRRKALTLLKMLVLQAGKPVARDVLIEQLWPEVEPSLGANRLYVLIHALREMIEPGDGDREPSIVLTEGDSYTFSLEGSCWLDLREFQALIDLGGEARRRGDHDQAMAVYQRAAALYRGDLLADEPFAEWCWLDREYFRETYFTVMRDLASLHIAAGEPEQAIACYRQVLRSDPLREDLHRQLLSALWLVDRRDEALREHEMFRQRLADELGTLPLPETRDLVEMIQRRRFPSPRRD